MNHFSQNALAFTCGLIAFEKLDMCSVPSVRFPWQQQHYNRWQLVVNKQNAFVTEEDRLLIKKNFNIKRIRCWKS